MFTNRSDQNNVNQELGLDNSNLLLQNPNTKLYKDSWYYGSAPTLNVGIKWMKT